MSPLERAWAAVLPEITARVEAALVAAEVAPAWAKEAAAAFVSVARYMADRDLWNDAPSPWIETGPHDPEELEQVAIDIWAHRKRHRGAGLPASHHASLPHQAIFPALARLMVTVFRTAADELLSVKLR